MSKVVIDDGSPVDDVELRAIEIRAHWSKWNIHGEMVFCRGDSIEQLISDRARLLRVVQGYRRIEREG